MDRRGFIKIGTAGIVGSGVPILLTHTYDTPVYSGWLPNSTEFQNFLYRNSRPYLTQQAPKVFTGSGKGKVVLLFKYLEREIGKLVPHHQAVGDCVGQAFGLGVDILTATQIHLIGRDEKWVSKASTEAIYAGSRYEIGYKAHGNKRLLDGDGTIGVYCAEFLRDYGVLVRKKYGDIDLTKYSAKLAREWGKNGVPDRLEPIAKRHPVRSFALVRSYVECRDAIANGYPVILSSSFGFNPNCPNCNPGGRDKQGFLKHCGKWFHSFCAIGSDDSSSNRPGLLLINSWGPNWVKGPTKHSQPNGSFWVDAKTIDRMCREGDSFAISSFVGFPRQRLNYYLF